MREGNRKNVEVDEKTFFRYFLPMFPRGARLTLKWLFNHAVEGFVNSLPVHRYRVIDSTIRAASCDVEDHPECRCER